MRKACGTPWVELPRNLMQSVGGIRPSDLLSNQPAEVLEDARGELEVVSSDEHETVYEVPVAAGPSIPTTSFLGQRPGVAKKLAREIVAARVRVRREGPITISVDLTDAFVAVLSQEVPLRVVWTVQQGSPKVQPSLPSNVAGSSCLSGG